MDTKIVAGFIRALRNEDDCNRNRKLFFFLFFESCYFVIFSSQLIFLVFFFANCSSEILAFFLLMVRVSKMTFLVLRSSTENEFQKWGSPIKIISKQTSHQHLLKFATCTRFFYKKTSMKK